ncbi:hypothetical protein M0802_014823 [Mischocyttarus mexicanus]|nr:hypothetical protein M0802_014823 [Mischocyttarus mexicanus]
MAMKIALQETRATVITGILSNIQDISSMDLATAEDTHSFLKSTWAKFDNKQLLVLAQVERLLDLPSVKTRTSQALHRIVNIVESSFSAIEALGCPVEHWGPIVLQRASSALDAKTREDWEHYLGASSELPPYQRLLTFISTAARALEHIEGHKDHKMSSRTSHGQKASPSRSFAKVLNLGPQTSQHPAPKPQTSQHSAATQKTSQRQPATPQTPDRPSQGHSMPFIQDLSNNCCYCRQRHYLAFCPQFSSLSRKARVEVVMEARLCFNCLGRHNIRQCRSTRRCNICGGQHHTLIHQEHRTSSTKLKTSQMRARSSRPISNTTMSSQRLPSSSSTPLLSDALSHQLSRRKSSQKRSSHKQLSHSRSSSSSTPASSS